MVQVYAMTSTISAVEFCFAGDEQDIADTIRGIVEFFSARELQVRFTPKSYPFNQDTIVEFKKPYDDWKAIPYGTWIVESHIRGQICFVSKDEFSKNYCVV